MVVSEVQAGWLDMVSRQPPPTVARLHGGETPQRKLRCILPEAITVVVCLCGHWGAIKHWAYEVLQAPY